jgi:hypothetical protein
MGALQRADADRVLQVVAAYHAGNLEDMEIAAQLFLDDSQVDGRVATADVGDQIPSGRGMVGPPAPITEEENVAAANARLRLRVLVTRLVQATRSEEERKG